MRHKLLLGADPFFLHVPIMALKAAARVGNLAHSKGVCMHVLPFCHITWNMKTCIAATNQSKRRCCTYPPLTNHRIPIALVLQCMQHCCPAKARKSMRSRSNSHSPYQPLFRTCLPTKYHNSTAYPMQALAWKQTGERSTS